LRSTPDTTGFYALTQSHLFLSPPGWGKALGEEINRVWPQGSCEGVTGRWMRVCEIHDNAAIPALAFALQTLPNAIVWESASIRQDADAVALRLREIEDKSDQSWQLHVFAPFEDVAATPGKAKLLGTAIRDSLKRKAKGLLRRLDDQSNFAPETAALAQVSWLKPSELALSWCSASERKGWRRAISPWPGGVAPIGADRRPPSRAYRKLLEAQAQTGREIQKGQTVADLGASPGGWSFVALDRGAHVVAIDRSPLDEPLMRHRRLRFVTGDAFRFRPDEPVDWMLTDVAAYPERTLQLIRDWLTNGWCRSLIATVKFVGDKQYAILEDFKAMLTMNAADFRIRKLLENKNEVTVTAWTAETSDTTSRSTTTANEA